uniref:Uncharacterized protein n=1 Tax=Manihot esculenta TaxID=3983 RepID=A0A2C9W7H2_MANES
MHQELSECSTTESSNDNEKQELQEVSEEDEASFYDTKEYFTEPTIIRESIKGAASQCKKHREPKILT